LTVYTIPNNYAWYIFSSEVKSLIDGLLARDVDKRLGCCGQGAEEVLINMHTSIFLISNDKYVFFKVKNHAFFHGVDWKQVYQQNYAPPFIPPKGEVNAADACDIGNFDEDDTKAVKITDQDQEIYRDFSLTISERWARQQAENILILKINCPLIDGNKKLLRQYLNQLIKKSTVWRRKTKPKSLQGFMMMKKKATASFRVTLKKEAILSPQDGKLNMQNYIQIGEEFVFS
jgi:hypothetical protein